MFQGEVADVVAAFLYVHRGQAQAGDGLAKAVESFAGDGHLRLRIVLVDVEAEREHQYIGLKVADGRKGQLDLLEEHRFRRSMGQGQVEVEAHSRRRRSSVSA